MAYIESRLDQWARWFYCRNDNGLGYPEKSLMYRIQHEGIVITKSQRNRYLPTHDNAETIEKLVCLMAQVQKPLADALRQYYLGREKTVALKARAIGMSETQFKEYVHRATAWLLGALTIMNNRYP